MAATQAVNEVCMMDDMHKWKLVEVAPHDEHLCSGVSYMCWAMKLCMLQATL